jgi:hypothetical protein
MDFRKVTPDTINYITRGAKNFMLLSFFFKTLMIRNILHFLYIPDRKYSQ